MAGPGNLLAGRSAGPMTAESKQARKHMASGRYSILSFGTAYEYQRVTLWNLSEEAQERE